MKKALCFVLSLITVVSIISGIGLSANAGIQSGYCGDNVQWSYDSSSKTLTIYGNGAMYDNGMVMDEYGSLYRHQWPISYEKLIIENGVAYIGYEAFRNSGIKSVTIPASVTRIGNHAFYGCYNLSSVYFKNDNCEIADNEETFCNSEKTDGIYSRMITFYCNKNSLPYNYAVKYNLDYFIPDSQCSHIAKADDYGSYYCVNCGSYLENYSNYPIYTTTTKPTTTTTTTKPTTTTAPVQTNTQPELSTIQPELSTTTTTRPTTPPAQTTTIQPATTVKKPKSTSISKLTKGKKQFKVTWKKVSGVAGYQIQYSTDKKFKKNNKTVTAKKSSTSATVKKLKSKKTYYVRVRTYKTTKVNGKTTKVYSSWSKVKSVKTK